LELPARVAPAVGEHKAVRRGGEADNALYQIGFGVPLRGEYFFSDHFALNASVGLGVDVGIEPSFVSFGTDSTGLFGNAGFVWYLD